MKCSKSREHTDCFVTYCIHSCRITFLIILSSILTLHCVAETRAIDPDKSAYGEYEVKAAYLYNFAKFISWPEDSFSSDNSLFNLCVLGENPFGDALFAWQSKKVSGKRVKVAYMAKVHEAPSCHLLFVSQSEFGAVDRILTAFEGHAIVTVSDIKGFAEAGGIIELTIDKGRIGFKINQGAALKQHLSINSSLLDLAKVVIQEDQ